MTRMERARAARMSVRAVRGRSFSAMEEVVRSGRAIVAALPSSLSEG